MSNNNGRILVVFSEVQETDYSYDALCNYYRNKQKENDMTHSEAKHEVGYRRAIVKFAFLPVIVEGRLKWFTTYLSIQEYTETIQHPDDWYCHPEPEYFWITVERKLIRK